MAALGFHPSVTEERKQQIIQQLQANNNCAMLATGEVVSLAEQRARADREKRAGFQRFFDLSNNTPDDAA